MFHFPRNYSAATVVLAAFSSAAFGQTIDLVCSGTLQGPKFADSTVGPGATRVDLEGRHISTPVGNFRITKVGETTVWFEGDPEKPFLQIGVGWGSLDRLSGKMTVWWATPNERAKWKAGETSTVALFGELRCSAAKRLF
jgi:hypothetical protein